MHPVTRRPRLAKALIVAAAVLACVGGVALYLDRAVFDSDAFADRATTALADQEVRAFISERVTDEAVKARPDLVSVRQVIGAGPAAIAASSWPARW